LRGVSPVPGEVLREGKNSDEMLSPQPGRTRLTRSSSAVASDVDIAAATVRAAPSRSIAALVLNSEPIVQGPENDQRLEEAERCDTVQS